MKPIKNSDNPDYVNLATKINAFNQSICANQSLFPTWIEKQNACLSNSASYFQGWLASLFSTSLQPNVDGPNDPVWGPVYTTFIFPFLEIVGIWNAIADSVQTTPIEFYSSFLAWWKTPCPGASVEEFIETLNNLLPFSVTGTSEGYIIGKCTGNPIQVAATLVSFVQSYSPDISACNMSLCNWNEQIYQQAWMSIGKTPPATQYNCLGSCSGDSCVCSTSAAPSPLPPCATCISSVAVLINETQLLNMYGGVTPFIISMSTSAAAITADGSYGYLNRLGNGIAVINIATGKIIHTIELTTPSTLFTACTPIVVSPNGQYAYAAGVILKEENIGAHAICVMNTSTYTYDIFISDFSFNLGDEEITGSAVISSDGEWVYFNNIVDVGGNIVGFNTSTSSFIEISGIQIGSLAISPNGEYIYVTSPLNYGVFVASTVTRSLVANINTPQISPTGPNIAISSDGQYVYICGNQSTSNGLQILDISTNVVNVLVYPSSGPQAVAASPDGKYIYTYDYDGNFTTIDQESNSILLRMPTGIEGKAFSISPILIGTCE